MNVNDPIAPRALAASHPDASPSEVDWQAWQLRYADMDRAVVARWGAGVIRRGAMLHRALWPEGSTERTIPDHRAIPTLSPGVCTCVRCGKPVRTAGGGLHAVHAQVG